MVNITIAIDFGKMHLLNFKKKQNFKCKERKIDKINNIKGGASGCSMLLAEKQQTVITLSSIYGHELQYIFEYIYHSFLDALNKTLILIPVGF